MERWRVRLRKGEELRFISHLDMARHLVRAVRRGRLPVAYSQGFSPRPRVQFGVPLLLGATSHSEFIDVVLSARVTREGLVEALSRELPRGLELVDAWQVPMEAPSLAETTAAIRYRVSGLAEEWNVEDAIGHLLRREEVLVGCERHGAGGECTGTKKSRIRMGRPRQVNIRRSVRELKVVESGGRFIEMTLLTSPGAAGPRELVRWLAHSGGWGEEALERLRIERTEQLAMVGDELVPITAELSLKQQEGVRC